jgi:hypothetical protein
MVYCIGFESLHVAQCSWMKWCLSAPTPRPMESVHLRIIGKPTAQMLTDRASRASTRRRYSFHRGLLALSHPVTLYSTYLQLHKSSLTRVQVWGLIYSFIYLFFVCLHLLRFCFVRTRFFCRTEGNNGVSGWIAGEASWDFGEQSDIWTNNLVCFCQVSIDPSLVLSCHNLGDIW